MSTDPTPDAGPASAGRLHPTPRAPMTPYYRRMARKEARVREDQFVALSRLVQVLARRRVVRGGPRLTENALIRIGIDLLLERANRLSGDTEVELRASVLDTPPSRWSGPALFDLDAADDARPGG